MGFDLIARRPSEGADDYYRAGIEFMAFLRSAMLAAGVRAELVYEKFVGNDHRLVTARESGMIAAKLTGWLRGRNLTLDLAETHPRAHAALDGLSFIVKAGGSRDEAARLAARLRAMKIRIPVDRKARIAVRDFSAFCAGSGGFYVD